MNNWWLLSLLLLVGLILSYRAGLPRGPRQSGARAIVSLLAGGAVPLLTFGGVVLLAGNLDLSAGPADFVQSVIWCARLALWPVLIFWLGTVLGKVLYVARGSV